MAVSGGTGDRTAVSRVWRTQSIWSQTANALKASVDRARSQGLLLGLAAAVLGVGSSQLMPFFVELGRITAFLSLVAAALTPYALRRASAQRLAEWVRVRSVSEALKSETYLYLAGLGPYGQDGGDADAAELTRRTRNFLDAASDLARHTRDIVPVRRELPSVSGADSYVTVRLASQLDTYYRPKAHAMARKVRITERAQSGLALLSAVLAAAAAAFVVDEAAAWIPVLATAGGAVTAHAAAANYAYQEMEFSRTAAELDRLIQQWTDGGRTEEEAQRLAERGEHIISIQNEGWMAKWTVEQGQNQG